MSLRVDTVPLGPVSVAARTFTRRGERRLVVVVKATCELVPDGAMRLLAPTPVADADLALRVPAAQIVVIGTSHAPPGAGVRVAVARGDAMLLDKRVEVPAGLPAGLGPLPPEAPVRRALLGGVAADAALRAFDVALPDGFDDRYFMVVPADQCASGPLAGGDLIALFHLHPQRGTLRTHLPQGSAVALLQTDRGARLPIKVKLDTVRLTPETMRAELVWRGDVRVDDEALRAARVAGAHGRAEGDFPDLATLPVASDVRAGPVYAGAAAPERRSRAATAILEPPPRASRRGRDGTMVLEAPPPEAEPPRRGRAGTMVLATDEAAAAGPHADVDDDAGPSTVLMPSPRAGAIVVDEPTIDAPPDAGAPRSMPFKRTRSIPPAEPARRVPLPGAPWSAQQARRAPRVRGHAASTVVLEVDSPAAAAQPGTAGIRTGAAEAPPSVAAPPPPPAGDVPAAPPVETIDPANPWRQDPPDRAHDAPPPVSPRAPRQRVSFKSDLYKKFKK